MLRDHLLVTGKPQNRAPGKGIGEDRLRIAHHHEGVAGGELVLDTGYAEVGEGIGDIVDLVHRLVIVRDLEDEELAAPILVGQAGPGELALRPVEHVLIEVGVQCQLKQRGGVEAHEWPHQVEQARALQVVHGIAIARLVELQRLAYLLPPPMHVHVGPVRDGIAGNELGGGERVVHPRAQGVAIAGAVEIELRPLLYAGKGEAGIGLKGGVGHRSDEGLQVEEEIYGAPIEVGAHLVDVWLVGRYGGIELCIAQREVAPIDIAQAHAPGGEIGLHLLEVAVIRQRGGRLPVAHVVHDGIEIVGVDVPYRPQHVAVAAIALNGVVLALEHPTHGPVYPGDTGVARGDLGPGTQHRVHGPQDHVEHVVGISPRGHLDEEEHTGAIGGVQRRRRHLGAHEVGDVLHPVEEIAEGGAEPGRHPRGDGALEGLDKLVEVGGLGEAWREVEAEIDTGVTGEIFAGLLAGVDLAGRLIPASAQRGKRQYQGHRYYEVEHTKAPGATFHIPPPSLYDSTSAGEILPLHARLSDVPGQGPPQRDSVTAQLERPLNAPIPDSVHPSTQVPTCQRAIQVFLPTSMGPLKGRGERGPGPGPRLQAAT